MGVEAVDYGVAGRVAGCLLGQVGRASAAEDEHVDIVGSLVELAYGAHGHVFGVRSDRRGIAAGEYSDKFHIVVLSDGELDAASEVSVAENADAYAFHESPCWLSCTGPCMCWIHTNAALGEIGKRIRKPTENTERRASHAPYRTQVMSRAACGSAQHYA